MKIHHIGYLVDNIENAAGEFEGLGFSRTGETAEDMSREIYMLIIPPCSASAIPGCHNVAF